MKKIILTIVFVLVAGTVFAQYKMSIKKADNTTEDIWVHDMINITFTNVAFTCGTNTIIYAGQTYNTVQIGTQCWLKENLNVGTRINGGTDQTSTAGTIEKYCYNDNDANCTSYGGLYQWAEAVQYLNGTTNTTSAVPAFTGNVQGICPTGWHIPTWAEYNTTLNTTVGGSGNSLKEIGQGLGAGSGTNTSGFSALLRGYRNYDGGFLNLGYYTLFWSSSENSGIGAGSMGLDFDNSDIHQDGYNKVYGYSVRCVKD